MSGRTGYAAPAPQNRRPSDLISGNQCDQRHQW